MSRLKLVESILTDDERIWRTKSPVIFGLDALPPALGAASPPALFTLRNTSLYLRQHSGLTLVL